MYNKRKSQDIRQPFIGPFTYSCLLETILKLIDKIIIFNNNYCHFTVHYHICKKCQLFLSNGRFNFVNLSRKTGSFKHYSYLKEFEILTLY